MSINESDIQQLNYPIIGKKLFSTLNMSNYFFVSSDLHFWFLKYESLPKGISEQAITSNLIINLCNGGALRQMEMIEEVE